MNLSRSLRARLERPSRKAEKWRSDGIAFIS
jgi:hypothetical protein